jgi:arylsulfatase A-like enzyme
MKNIVLITVDCLRADHVGFLGYNRATTPFLDRLACESLVVPSAIAAGSPTYYSLPAMLAARPSLGLGRDVVGLAPGELTLASCCRAAGFQTAAFSAANPYISAQFGYDIGFDVFRDYLSESIKPISPTVTQNGGSSLNRFIARTSHSLGSLGNVYDELYFQYCQRWASPKPQSIQQLQRFPSADRIVDDSTAWLHSIGESPCFLWLHLMDPHAPYYPHQEVLKEAGLANLSPETARYWNAYWNRSDARLQKLARHRQNISALYDAAIRWVDCQLERLVAALREFGRWDDCVFAVTADHGEEFLDHGRRFHAPNTLYEETIHVPLLLRVPETASRKIPKSPLSLLHLAPTLLDAAEVGFPGEFAGTSYWPQLTEGACWDEPAIVECVKGCTNPFEFNQRLAARVLAARGSRFKLIIDFETKQELFFDLEQDPAEHIPLPAGAESQARRRLLESAYEHMFRQRDERSRLRARARDLRLEWAKTIA